MVNTPLRTLRTLFQTRVPELFVFFLGGLLIAQVSVVRPYPAGYAGLYSLMAELVSGNGFKLPADIPYYATKNIPYAYPPLGFYIEAAMLRLTKISALNYARIFPAIFGVIALVTIYWLFQKISNNRLKALTATFLFSTASAFLELHVQAAGTIRAPALVFALLSLGLAWQNQQPARSQTLLAGVFFGLTILTHLAYAVFAALSLSVFTIFCQPGTHKQQIQRLAWIFTGGMVIAAPWWLTIFLRYGPGIFLKVFQTHQNTLLTSSISAPLALPANILIGWIVTGPWLNPAALTGFALIGVAYWLTQKRWMMLAWLLAIIYLTGESLRFQLILYCLASADAMVDYLQAHLSEESRSPAGLYRSFFAGLLIVAFVFFSASVEIRKTDPSLTSDAIQLAAWFKNNTPASSRYLYFDSNPDGLNEWMPYLTQRVPANGHWGHEWLDDYQAQQETTYALATCAKAESWPCAQSIIEKNRLVIDYLVLPNNLAGMQFDASQTTRLVKTYENAQFSVYIVK